MDDTCGLCRKDLGLPVVVCGSVQWDGILRGSDLSEFRERRARRAFVCFGCGGIDVVEFAGAYGKFWMSECGSEWEEKHFLDVLGDDPEKARCVKCQFAAIPCKYDSVGQCWRGAACSFKHFHT